MAYEGTAYAGWQVQNLSCSRKSAPKTVQQEVEAAVKRLFNRKISLICAGRTDRGVHANSQGVNFKIDTEIPFYNIKQALNTFLPSDIRVKKVKSVGLDFHSRFSARSKIYRYIILNSKEQDVFRRNFSWHIRLPLDLDKMKKVSKKLIGKKDFSLFAKDSKDYLHCVREVKNISFKRRGSFIYIDIDGDGFLRSMARNIVSFLVKAGAGKLSFKESCGILAGKIKYSNKPAPAAGLYLYKVKYGTVSKRDNS